MSPPAEISQETAAWLQQEIEQAVQTAVTPLRQEIDQLDDWANGLLAVLMDVMPGLLTQNPALAEQCEQSWGKAAAQFEALEIQPGQQDDFHQTQPLLEARKMLYGWLRQRSVFHAPDAGL